MAIEIEVKAWVDDWAAMEARLRARCRFRREFVKEDRYFRRADIEHGGPVFRVRVDPGSTDRGSAVVTSKEKSHRDGMEYNEEREFTVDDPEELVALATRMGCVEESVKVKRGLDFEHDGLTVELVHVEGVGDFIEVEYLAESPEDARADDSAVRIRAFLESVGVREDSFESRRYTELIRLGVRRPQGGES